MTNRMKWLLGAAVALTLSGLVYAGSAVAANRMPMHGMGGMMNMMGKMGSMGAMHAMHHGSGGMMAGMMDQMPAMHAQMMGKVAALLNMSEADLEAAMQKSTPLKDLAAERGVAPEALRTLMIEEMQAFMETMVADGRITAEQAEQMSGMMAEHADMCLSGQMDQMMKSMQGMHGKGCH